MVASAQSNCAKRTTPHTTDEDRLTQFLTAKRDYQATFWWPGAPASLHLNHIVLDFSKNLLIGSHGNVPHGITWDTTKQQQQQT